MAKPSVTAVYKSIMSNGYTNVENVSVPFISLHLDELPDGIKDVGLYNIPRGKRKPYFMLNSDLSERIITDYKGVGVKALMDKMTMTEKGVIQKPRLFLRSLGLKKDIALLTHNENRDIIIVVNDNSGAEYANNLLNSLLKK